MNRRTDIPQSFMTHSAQEGPVSTFSPVIPPAPKKKPRRVLRGLGWTAALFVAFSVGMGVNSGSGQSVEVTPDACVTAIERADEILYLAGEGFGASAAALEAVAQYDVAGVQAAADDMAELNGQVEGIDYRTPADECVAGAR